MPWSLKRARVFTMGRLGPPLGLTPEIQASICDLIKAGAPVPSAAAACGVLWETCKKWLAKGRKGREPYAAFVAEVERSKGVFVAGRALTVQKAGDSDWKAAAWLLERRCREFSLLRKTEITGRDGGPVQVEDVDRGLAAKLAAFAGDEEPGDDIDEGGDEGYDD